MRLLFSFGKILAFLGVLALGAREARPAEANGSRPFIPEFQFPAALPAVLSAAQRTGLSLEGVDHAPADGATTLEPGDRATALVSLLDGGKTTQWLLEVNCVAPTAEEKAQPPPRSWTLHTNTGTEVSLSGTRAVLALRVLGPFDAKSAAGEAAPAPPEKRARLMVNAEYLSFGLDRACEAVMAVNAAKLKNPALAPATWSLRPQPFPAEEAQANRKKADAIGLTPERERALAGASPALQEFFHIISRTPGLQDILKSVIDVPWWTVIKRGGNVPIAITPQFGLTQEIPASDPLRAGSEGNAYTLPFSLFIGGKPALVGKLAVVNPARPLLAGAGITAVVACAPDGKGPRVTLQIVSAHLGHP